MDRTGSRAGAEVDAAGRGSRVFAGPVRAAWSVAAALGVLALAGTARAHERSVSRSELRVEAEGAEIRLTIAAVDAERLVGTLGVASDAALAEYAREHLVARDPVGPCRAGAAVREPRAPGFLGFRWRVECGAPEVLESRLFAEVAPHHLHFARVRAGGSTQELVLAEGARAAEIGAPLRRSWLADITFGAGHVLSGIDHLAFLLTLVLAARSLRAVAVVATGFSLGHTLTLVLAALGVLRPEAASVEAVIGLSVVAGAAAALRVRAGLDRVAASLAPLVLGLAAAALVVLAGGAGAMGLVAAGVAAACHLARGRGEVSSQVTLAAVFGLVHGLGFAGALAEARLPAGELVRMLVGFNVGIELAQVLVAGAAWSLLGALERRAEVVHAGLVRAALVVVMAAGTCWTLTRALAQ